MLMGAVVEGWGFRQAFSEGTISWVVGREEEVECPCRQSKTLRKMEVLGAGTLRRSACRKPYSGIGGVTEPAVAEGAWRGGKGLLGGTVATG